MAGCEKCWRDARGEAERYHRLVDERDRAGQACTPEEQCGELHVVLRWKDGRAPQCRCGKVVGDG